MKTNQAVGREERSELPVGLWIGGTSIGGAIAVEPLDQEPTGTFRFEGLDFIARVFFAERVGPGGPGANTTIRDVRVTDRLHQRTMLASEATVLHFSAGTGELELTALVTTNERPPARGRR